MRIASAGHYNTANLAAILAVALIGYVLWRNYRRRGQLVRGPESRPPLTPP